MADLTRTSGRAPQGDGQGDAGQDGDGHDGDGRAREGREGRGGARKGAGKPIPTPASAAPAIDPRAVRVHLGPASGPGVGEPLVLAPLPAPLAPRVDSLAGRGILGGQAPSPAASVDIAGEADQTSVLDASPAAGPTVLVDGEPVALRVIRRGAGRAVLVEGEGTDVRRARVVFTGTPVTGDDGILRREVVVDGWRIDIELESERRAALRERARRGHEATAHGGPTEVRAIIPGRVVSVSVAPGDALTAGQQILVVEAMKMQNELRSPRDGTVQKVGVAPGENIEVGDLLLVIE